MSKTLVLLVLAVVWGVALVPPLLRSRVHHRPGSSVTSFRRQLSNLSRMPAAVPMSASRAFRASPGMPIVGPGAARPAGVLTASRLVGAPGYAVRSHYARSSAAIARSQVRRRRQNVLFVLTAATLVSGLLWLGFAVAAGRTAFFVSVIALGLYVYLLVMLRRAEEDRLDAAARTYAYSDAA
jgi:hypothetical protein